MSDIMRLEEQRKVTLLGSVQTKMDLFALALFHFVAYGFCQSPHGKIVDRFHQQSTLLKGRRMQREIQTVVCKQKDRLVMLARGSGSSVFEIRSCDHANAAPVFEWKKRLKR